jgi:hypothetical protein
MNSAIPSAGNDARRSRFDGCGNALAHRVDALRNNEVDVDAFTQHHVACALGDGPSPTAT